MSSRAATPRGARLGRDPLALRPLADDDEPRLLLAPSPRSARTSRGRFLTARKPATVPITTSPGLRSKPGISRVGRRREARDRRRRWECATGGCGRHCSRAIRSSRADGTTSA